MSRIARTPGLFPGALVAALLAAALTAPPRAQADDAPEDMVKLAVRFEPPQVAPGGKGVAVVTATLAKGLHLEAGPKLLTITLKPAAGVTYGEVTRVTPPIAWKDPEFPDDPAKDVWFDHLEIRIAFSLAADAPADAQVGAVVKWNGCSSVSGQCYFKIEEPFGVAVPRVGVVPVLPAPVAGPPVVVAAPGAAPPAGGCAAPKAAVRLDSDAATVDVWIAAGKVLLCFSPKKGLHLYSPQAVQSDPILVAGIASEGITWGAMQFPASEEEIKSPVEVSVPYTTTSTTPLKAKIHVHWQGCTDVECLGFENVDLDLELSKDGGKVLPPTPKAPAVPPPAMEAGDPTPAGPSGTASPTATAGTPDRGILFPVYRGDGSSEAAPAEKTLWELIVDKDIQGLWKRVGILILLFVFVLGIGLAFTPCVLPIIPITVSIIGGGRPDLSRSRLTLLLSCYVGGLALAFGSMGLVASLTGGSMSAAFESPVASWLIPSIFLVLSLGMFGIYELQPPQFLQRLQGGAKGGSVVGAFAFGALGAVIASPCTGPVIVAMLLFTAQAGNALIGFLMFVTLGLGMGSVFFAAGSLNLLMRPGPWMVWIRYGFGVMLIGVALYYPASSGQLPPIGLFAVGFAIALLVAAGITRHLVKGEGEPLQPAMVRGAKAAIGVVAATLVVALMTRPAGGPVGWWTSLRDRSHLVAEVEKAKKDGKATVIDVWATWCHYCRVYDEVIEGDPELKAGFDAMRRLRVDVTDDQRPDLRDGVGIEAGQPRLVFIDREGRIRRAMDLFGMEGGKDTAKENLKKRLRELGVLGTKVAAAGN